VGDPFAPDLADAVGVRGSSSPARVGTRVEEYRFDAFVRAARGAHATSYAFALAAYAGDEMNVAQV
jgi:hypothetical protein